MIRHWRRRAGLPQQKQKRECGGKRVLREVVVAVRRGSGGSVWRERGSGSCSKAGQRETVPHAACASTRRQKHEMRGRAHAARVERHEPVGAGQHVRGREHAHRRRRRRAGLGC